MLRTFAVAIVATVGPAMAQNQFDLDSLLVHASKGFPAVTEISDAGVSTNGFGCEVIEGPVTNGFVFEKTVRAPETPYHLDQEQQARFLRESAELHKNVRMAENGATPTYNCTNREPGVSPTASGQFFPVLAAEVSESSPTATYSSSKCFDEIQFEFVETSDTTFDVMVTTSEPKSHLCNDTILFGNTEIQHFEAFYFKGTHKLSFEMTTSEAQADVGFGGIKAFAFCDGILGEIESLWKFVKSFTGGLTPHPDWPIIGSHVPPYMEHATLDFLRDAMDYVMEPRETKKVEIDPDLIQSGDFLAVMRLEGLGAMIMYGTGSHLSHSTMALRFDGELYVVESQGAGFWPVAGIQKTKWADWIKQAEDSSFHVAWLPLNAEKRAQFDEKAANDFFAQTEGLPYGFHNFLYGWVDTANDNWPPILPKELVPVAFKVFEDLEPKKADIFFTQALNKRLGTEGKNISEIAELAAKQGMSVEDVMAMVEQDGWEYSGIEPKDGQAYVCSAYVAAMYKAAGLFGDDYVNGTEFVPRDVYSLAFFDSETARPDACVSADPTSPFCQLLGNYRITLPGYNSVQSYAHMNEHCTINWPSYDRDAGC